MLPHCFVDYDTSPDFPPAEFIGFQVSVTTTGEGACLADIE